MKTTRLALVTIALIVSLSLDLSCQQKTLVVYADTSIYLPFIISTFKSLRECGSRIPIFKKATSLNILTSYLQDEDGYGEALRSLENTSRREPSDSVKNTRRKISQLLLRSQPVTYIRISVLVRMPTIEYQFRITDNVEFVDGRPSLLTDSSRYAGVLLNTLDPDHLTRLSEFLGQLFYNTNCKPSVRFTHNARVLYDNALSSYVYYISTSRPFIINAAYTIDTDSPSNLLTYHWTQTSLDGMSQPLPEEIFPVSNSAPSQSINISRPGLYRLNLSIGDEVNGANEGNPASDSSILIRAVRQPTLKCAPCQISESGRDGIFEIVNQFLSEGLSSNIYVQDFNNRPSIVTILKIEDRSKMSSFGLDKYKLDTTFMRVGSDVFDTTTTSFKKDTTALLLIEERRNPQHGTTQSRYRLTIRNVYLGVTSSHTLRTIQLFADDGYASSDTISVQSTLDHLPVITFGFGISGYLKSKAIFSVGYDIYLTKWLSYSYDAFTTDLGRDLAWQYTHSITLFSTLSAAIGEREMNGTYQKVYGVGLQAEWPLGFLSPFVKIYSYTNDTARVSKAMLSIRNAIATCGVHVRL